MDSPPLSECSNPATLCTIIGGGVLGTCLIDGLIEKGAAAVTSKVPSSSTTGSKAGQQFHIRITTRRSKHAAELRHRYPNLLVVDDNRSPLLWKESDPWSRSHRPAHHVVLICTQPEFTQQVCRDVSAVAAKGAFGLGGSAGGPAPVFVTMCPGITVEALESWLPKGAAVVRTMPNTPISVYQGATAMYANETAAKQGEALRVVQTLFETVSPAVHLLPREDLIDVAAAVSGSGPAYIFSLLASLVEAGVRRGLPRDLATALVKQTGFGASYLAMKDERSLQDLVDDVCVPGGSTEKAMTELRKGDFETLVDGAAERSYQANIAMGS